MLSERIQPLEIQKYVNRSREKGIISFAAGLPDLSVLPLNDLKKTYREIQIDPASFQYQPPIQALKEKIQTMMSQISVPCTAEEIIITNGAQQAIYLTAQLFFKENAPLITEEFVYPGFSQLAHLFNLRYLTLPYHSEVDLDLDQLEYYLKTQSPLPYLYVVCNGHNPYGSTLSPETRQKLSYLSEKYNFILVEDDPYGYLSYEDDHYLPLRAYTRNAIYIGSFSKLIAPSLRVGWIVADEKIIKKIQHLKDIIDLYILNPNHLILNAVLDNRSLSDIVRPQKLLYKEKLDYMISLLSKHFPYQIQYTIPKHGVFLWLEFYTKAVDTYAEEIINRSNVLYIPGSAFSLNKKNLKQMMRLNFSYPSFKEIEVGIHNLSMVLNSSNATQYPPLELKGSQAPVLEMKGEWT